MKKKVLCFMLFFLNGFFSLAENGKFSLFLKNFTSEYSNFSREIHVYLPPEYHQKPASRYPVVYMQDGQNVYDPTRAFMGQTWEAEITLNRLISSGQIEPIIVVAVDNTPDRINEYTHDKNLKPSQGGQAAGYLKLVAIELKSRIDSSFRTQILPESTAIMGSSLGGLVSLYAGIIYPEVFGKVAALSPSIWWNNKTILELYDRALQLPTKLYADSGTIGGEKPQDVLLLRDNLRHRYIDSENIQIVIQSGANHSERYWAQRLPETLKFLFPRRR